MSTDNSRLAAKSKFGFFAILPILTVFSLALSAADTIAASRGPDAESTDSTSRVSRFLEDANKALNAGKVNLALIELKNAALLAPTNGEVRARLGAAMLLSGDAAAAERELRQAQSDHAPSDLVIPPLLRAMLRRNEIKELLAEFPDPPQGNEDKTAADILAARAMALQISDRPKEARAAMDRSLLLRRDVAGLVASARLAQQQGDLALAGNLTDEAIKLSPSNEAALSNSVLLARQAGDIQKAMAIADEYVRRAPYSIAAKTLRIEVLVDLKQDARANQEVDALLKEEPNSSYGRYFRGVLMARGKDFKGAWREMQNLRPELVQSQPSIAMAVAGVALASGNSATGEAILTTFVVHHPDNRLARLQLAAIRLDHNAPEAAINTLAPLKASNDPVAHALLAQAYLRLHRFDEAVESLEIANSLPKANDLLRRQLALSELQAGDADQAIEGLQALLERNPSNATFAAPMIAALVGAAKWDEALGIADAWAKGAPKIPLPAFYRGQILIARGDLSGAAAEFTKAFALDSKFVPALYYRANVSLARGNPEEATKDLQLILAQNPADMLAYMRLTQIALDNGQDEEALALLARATKAAPKDPTPRLALANYEIRHGKYQEAETTVSGLLQISRDNPEGLALRGQIQFLLGRTPDAIKTFRMLAASATSAAAYDLLARALYIAKDQSSAEDSAKRAIELAPNSAETRKELIEIQLGGGKGEDALATARSYAGKNPGSAADILLAETLTRLKRTNEAEDLLEKSFDRKPDARVAVRFGQIAASSGDAKKARPVLAKWLAKDPDNFAVRSEYAASLMAVGDFADARKEYEALLKNHPYDPIILNNAGSLLQKDDPDRAFSLVALARKVAPQSPEIVSTLGWMKYQHRDYQGAMQLLQRAHDMDGGSAVISYRLALALDAAGNRAEAKTLLQATLAKNSKFDGADDAKQVLARW